MTRIVRRSAFGVLTGMSIVMGGVCAAHADSISVSPGSTIDFGDVTVGTTDTIVATATFNVDAGQSFEEWGPTLFLTAPLDPFFLTVVTSPTGNCMSSTICNVDISFSPTTTGTFTNGFTFSGAEEVGIGIVDDPVDLEGTGVAPATPLPAALPLFATGLGALGLLGWRRKRKARVSLLGAA